LPSGGTRLSQHQLARAEREAVEAITRAGRQDPRLGDGRATTKLAAASHSPASNRTTPGERTSGQVGRPAVHDRRVQRTWAGARPLGLQRSSAQRPYASRTTPFVERAQRNSSTSTLIGQARRKMTSSVKPAGSADLDHEPVSQVAASAGRTSRGCSKQVRDGDSGLSRQSRKMDAPNRNQNSLGRLVTRLAGRPREHDGDLCI